MVTHVALDCGDRSLPACLSPHLHLHTCTTTRLAGWLPCWQAKMLLAPLTGTVGKWYVGVTNARLAAYGLRYDDLYDPLKDEVRMRERRAASGRWFAGQNGGRVDTRVFLLRAMHIRVMLRSSAWYISCLTLHPRLTPLPPAWPDELRSWPKCRRHKIVHHPTYACACAPGHGWLQISDPCRRFAR
jgi:hypothetical protein